jgi:hypothetical protein
MLAAFRHCARMTGNPSVREELPIRPESLVSLATPPLVDAHVVELYVGSTDLSGHHQPFRKARTPDQMRRSPGTRGDRGARMRIIVLNRRGAINPGTASRCAAGRRPVRP